MILRKRIANHGQPTKHQTSSERDDECNAGHLCRRQVRAKAHRAGLGLDVNYLDNAQLNREELRGKKPTKSADDNVSDEEKRLFAEKEKADKEADEAIAKRKALEKQQAELKNLKKTNPGKVDPIKEAALAKALEEATENTKRAQDAKNSANDAWNDERDKNEPAKVKGYRASLSKCKSVSQIFDPWFMDANTQDQIAAKPNEQRDANEKLHAHHLHVTVRERKIRK